MCVVNKLPHKITLFELLPEQNFTEGKQITYLKYMGL